MKFLIIFALFVASIFADDKEINDYADCGKRPVIGDNVVGGSEATPGSWPFICGLEYTTAPSNINNFRHSCGCSILNRKWVITAAHCVSGRMIPANFLIRIGHHDRNSQTAWQTYRFVDKIVMHPGYVSSTTRNDIAIMRLSQAIEYDNNYILPTCLYDGAEALDYSRTAWAAGWGTTSSGGSLAAKLQEVEMPITTEAACRSYYGSSYYANEMICIGKAGDGKDTCQGDSGGPVVYKTADGRWKLIGLTSWGYGCGDIGVYTRVSTYLQWTIDNVRNNTD